MSEMVRVMGGGLKVDGKLWLGLGATVGLTLPKLVIPEKVSLNPLEPDFAFAEFALPEKESPKPLKDCLGLDVNFDPAFDDPLGMKAFAKSSDAVVGSPIESNRSG